MSFIILEDQGRSKRLFYREYGKGLPLLFLHGGWGYEIYPFDVQIRALSDAYRILIPDRTGYGQTSRVTSFPMGFHWDVATEMTAFLDALGVGPCVLWGHSDGAISAVLMGMLAPERHPAVVLEAIHYDRRKPRSRGFFETMVSNPKKFGPKVAEILANEHGEDYWERLLAVEGQVWLDILDHCEEPQHDLYGERIGDLRVPSLLLHGSEDPRTEPGELNRLQAALPRLQIHVLPGAGHSPHSEPGFAEEATAVARRFLAANSGADSEFAREFL